MEEQKIFHLVLSDNTQEVKDYLEHNLQVKLANLVNARGFHILHIAALAGNVDILAIILKHLETEMPNGIGSIINVQDWSGLTPLHYACNEGWADIVTMLLNHGANPTITNEDSLCYFGGMRVPIYVSGGKTPLHFCAEHGDIEGIHELLKAHTALKEVKDLDGNTPYTLALLANFPEAAKLLAPSPEAPTQQDEVTRNEKKIADQKQRASRISQKEREKDQQKKEISRQCISAYRPLHPEIFSLSEDYFHESFIQAICANSEDSIRSLVKEETNGVYSFDMLKLDFCKKLIEESEYYEQSGLPVNRPNSMNNYGVILDEIGFQHMMDDLMDKYITPMARVLFPDFSDLDSHHAFIVKYKLGQDVSLSTHIDDSEVTLNVCLGKEFTGGTLFFRGIKGISENTPEFEFAHTPGKAILHVGKHVHGANELIGGERANLIVWCRIQKLRNRS